MGYLDTIGNVGDVLTSANQAGANGRSSAAILNQAQALAQANIYRSQLGAAMSGPTASAHSTALGDTMANVKPFEWGDPKMVGNIPVPTASGGLTPANFGPNTRAAGQNLSTLSAARVTSPTFDLPTPPVLPPIPTAGPMSNIMSTAGLLSKLAQAIGGSGKPGAAGSGGGGDIGQLLKSLFGNHSNTASEANSPQHHEEDTRGLTGDTSGQAFGPDGQPLPGTDDGGGYYDENGQYIPDTTGAQGYGADQQPVDWSWLFNGGGYDNPGGNDGGF